MDEKYQELSKRVDFLEERLFVYAVFGIVGLATVILGVLIITR